MFYDPNGDRQLSQEAYHFIAGLLAHVKACAPSPTPWSTPISAWSPVTRPLLSGLVRSNRSALIRIPAARGNSTRVELRSPDPACNPIWPWRHALPRDWTDRAADDAPRPLTGNLYEVGDASGIQRLPGSLEEAVRAWRQTASLRTR